MYESLHKAEHSTICVIQQACKIVFVNHIVKGYSSSHDQVVLDIRQRCWLRMVKVDESKTSEL